MICKYKRFLIVLKFTFNSDSCFLAFTIDLGLCCASCLRLLLTLDESIQKRKNLYFIDFQDILSNFELEYLQVTAQLSCLSYEKSAIAYFSGFSACDRKFSLGIQPAISRSPSRFWLIHSKR